jgi:hypothetical protein
MTDYLLIAMWSGWIALLILVCVAQLHRKKLIKWALAEQRWLRQESDEIQVMRKFLMQQNEWDKTRGFYGNPVMNAAFDGRIAEYNRRRLQLIAVLDKIPKLLPW